MIFLPIETAPIGQQIILVSFSGMINSEYSIESGCRREGSAAYPNGRWVDDRGDNLSDHGFEPIGWLPMPSVKFVQTHKG